nr:flagellar hook-length control protein FliK [Ancylobacter koreensis]
MAVPTATASAGFTATAASPALQLADAIAEAVRVGGTDATPAAAGTPPLARGPVRVLEIQLHPVELGLVTVRLRTGRNGLEVQIHAAREETARLIESDRARLLDTLAEQGSGPIDLLIARPGTAAGLTGYDAQPRHSDSRADAPSRRDAPAGEDPDPDSRRRRQDHDEPSHPAADADRNDRR